MYICICNAVTEKQLQNVINANANITTNQLIKSGIVGNECGKCIKEVKSIINETIHINNSQQCEH